MRFTILFLLLAVASPAFAARPFVDFAASASNGSGLSTSTEGGTTFDKERYGISARLRTSRLGADAPGTREEYRLRVARELYFVTLAGSLATSPPNSQGAAYHIAAAEAWFKFYGSDLGPEHPELSPDIWESSGPVPDPASLDRTWITRFGGAYTNANNHLTTNGAPFTLVEGAWQFSLLETYRETTTLGVQLGGSRYNKSLDGSTPVASLNLVDFWGNVLPISGWPNNWQSLRVERKLGAFAVSGAGTQLNMLDGSGRVIVGAEVAWTQAGRWTYKAGVERLAGSGVATRSALSLGLSRRW